MKPLRRARSWKGEKWHAIGRDWENADVRPSVCASLRLTWGDGQAFDPDDEESCKVCAERVRKGIDREPFFMKVYDVREAA